MRNSGNTPSSKPLFFVAEQWNHKKGSWVIQEEWEIYLHSWNSKGNLQPTEDKDLIALSRGHLDHYGQQEIICHRSVLVSLTPCFVILSICPSIYFPVSYQVAKSLLQRAYFYCVYSVSFTGRLHLSILARSLEMHLSRRSWQLLDSQETESKLVLCESYSKCNSCVLQNIFLTDFSQAKLWLFCQYLLNSSVLAFSKIALGLANTKKQHCWREWQARQPPPPPHPLMPLLTAVPILFPTKGQVSAKLHCKGQSAHSATARLLGIRATPQWPTAWPQAGPSHPAPLEDLQQGVGSSLATTDGWQQRDFNQRA